MTVLPPPQRRRGRRRAVVAVLACLVTALLACTPEPVTEELEHAVAKEAQTQAPDMVDVTVYFRHGKGPMAYLVPVVREVQVGEALPRTALDLMLMGPQEQDPTGLRPAVPTTTTIRDFAVDESTANVDLSGHVVRDAAEVGPRPEHELLALAAIANTLTEFPEISRVAVTIDGQAGGRFWGGWGLPEVLLRDDSVVSPEATMSAMPTLAGFSRRPQHIGRPGQPRGVVSRIRIRPRSTYLRVTVELEGVQGAALGDPVPLSKVTRKGDDIRLSVGARPSRGLAGRQVIEDPTFEGARIDVKDNPPSVSVTIRPNHPAAFSLRALTDPTRVVLDIRR